MAGKGRLSGMQKIDLAAAISPANMRSIAQGYMDMDSDTLDSFNQAEFNMKVLERWTRFPENLGEDQIEKLEGLLHRAAGKHALVDMNKVRRILHESETAEATPVVTTTPGAQSTPGAVAGSTGATAPATPSGGGEGPELTDAMIGNLAEMFSQKSDLDKLVVNGLGFESSDVNKSIRDNNNDCAAAAKAVILDWADSQDDREVAYVMMCAALRHKDVKKGGFVKKYLQG